MLLWFLVAYLPVTPMAALRSWTHIHWDCDLVTHNASSVPEGRGEISSAGYPAPFPDRRLCVRHELIAPESQLVELTIADVDLHPSTARSGPIGCLSVFLRWPSSSAGDPSPLVTSFPRSADVILPVTSYSRSADVILCHNTSVGRRSWYSSARRMALEFASEGNSAGHRGFSATFKFVDRAEFVTRGQRLPGTHCRLLLLSEDRLTGHIYSEGFPAASPTRNCSYTLYGERGQRVVLSVTRLTLQLPDSSCVAGDRVTVHDGTTARAQVIAELCRSGRSAKLTSSGPYLHVASHVTSYVTAPTSRPPPHHRPVAGFQLKYRFEADPVKQGLPHDIVPSNFNKYLDKMNVSGFLIGDQLNRTSVYLPPETPCETSCHRMVLSGQMRTGEIQSPAYPLPYPANILCRYEFQGKGNERIIIRFKHFDLGRNSTLKTCYRADSVAAFALSAGRLRLLRRLCGSGQPSSIMSTDSRLLLLFATGGATSAEPTGFSATYQFVENYGITTGLQLPTSSCAFEFRSSMVREGSFRTPNAPSYYPGETNCHFQFIGGVNETVLIQFSYFDVEGIYPCRLSSASDYVEVNPGQGDGPPERYCGDTAPANPLISDGAQLRLTFHSNGRFEATGFEARFRFVSGPGGAAVAPAASTGAAELRLPLTACRLLLAACVLRLSSVPGPG